MRGHGFIDADYGVCALVGKQVAKGEGGRGKGREAWSSSGRRVCVRAKGMAQLAEEASGMARGEQAGGVGAVGEDGRRDMQVGFGVHAWDVCGVYARSCKRKKGSW